MDDLSHTTSLGGQRKILSYQALVVSAYVAAITAAEVLMVGSGVLLGTLLDAFIIFVLVIHYVFIKPESYRRILPALALVPLLRILSLTVPVRQAPRIEWYFMIGAPLLIAVWMTIRLLKLTRDQIGLQRRVSFLQIRIGLSGLLLGLVAYLILRPQLLTAYFDLGTVVLGSVILTIFSGFTEELMFRGVLQQTATEIFGGAGILVGSILFGAMAIGTMSLTYAVYIGLVGAYLGWVVKRTDSIWGAVIAHSLLNISMLFIWPYILR